MHMRFIYAPTLSTPDNVEQLNSLIGMIPQAETLLLLGDFNTLKTHASVT